MQDFFGTFAAAVIRFDASALPLSPIQHNLGNDYNSTKILQQYLSIAQ